MNEPLTISVPELAARWKLTPQQTLESALQRGVPLYFYFDGLVFDFKDKWHRAHGDTHAAAQFEAKTLRLADLDIDLARQRQHKKGLLKLTQWEEAMSDEALQSYQAEADRLTIEVAELGKQLDQRKEFRQRAVRNGVLRAAPKTLQKLVQHAHTEFPQFAYMPAAASSETGVSEDTPTSIAPAALVALEDGFPLREQLRAEDLFANFLDVKAAEK
jgi:hypothetical protein